MHAPADDDLPAPGTVLAGKYEIVRVLGRGGMGVVLEAQHLRLNQRVALKLLLPSVRADQEVTLRFEREARAAARLQGPHVARILDVDALPDGSPFMVMELLRGRELGHELAARGTLPYGEAVDYILQACAGMAEAHRAGIVHRDLKPSNLFLCEQDGRCTVKVLDFGISKLTGDVQVSVTTTASAFGTPLYMSPEQVRSVKHVDARADIWSLGVVLYELLAGVPPFDYPSATAILAAIIADTPRPIRAVRPDVPGPLADAVMRALEKDPDRRFAGVAELAAAIAPYSPARTGAVGDLLAVRVSSPSLLTSRASSPTLATAATVMGDAVRLARPARPAGAIVAAVVAAAVLSLGAVFAVRHQRVPVSAPVADLPTAAPGPSVALGAAVEKPAPAPQIEPAPAVSAAPSAPGPHRPAASRPGAAPVPVVTPRPQKPVDDPKYL